MQVNMRHGGKILADQLAILGVERVFSVPGESFLAALDGLYDSGIRNIVCRQEGGAAMMAEADGKLTGRPGVAFVTPVDQQNPDTVLFFPQIAGQVAWYF